MSSTNGRKQRVHITVMITPDLKASLAQAAQAEERSMGWIIEQALASHLQRRAHQPQPVVTTL